MIVDRLERHQLYAGLVPRLIAAFEFLHRPGLTEFAEGRHLLDGEHLFALVQRYSTRPVAESAWEAHRRYIDLQYLIAGSERIGYAPLEQLAAGAYDAGRDLLLLQGEGDWLTLHAGEFVLLFPHDAHRPCVAVTEPAAVHKVVVKIAVD